MYFIINNESNPPFNYPNKVHQFRIEHENELRK